MRVYYDRDADVNLIKSKKVAIVGYGSQGRAHALNLKDSGATRYQQSRCAPALPTAKKAEADGFEVKIGCRSSGLGRPDDDGGAGRIAGRYLSRSHIADNIRDGAAIAFAHGLNVHFGLIEPKETVDVLMVAPKGPGPHRARRIPEGWRRALFDCRSS